jgi:DNA-binding winged helix-turn-helix (wHTH) protein
MSLDEAEDAKKFCPHCYSRLDATMAPTILPPPWFDHDRRQVIVGNERRQMRGGMPFRLLGIFWERPDRLLSVNVLMDLLYANKMETPHSKIITMHVYWLRKALRGTPYSILSKFGEGYLFTMQSPDKREVIRIRRMDTSQALHPERKPQEE